MSMIALLVACDSDPSHRRPSVGEPTPTGGPVVGSIGELGIPIANGVGPLAIGDLTGDGVDDLVLADAGAAPVKIRVLAGPITGPRDFETPDHWVVPPSPYGIGELWWPAVAGDLDGDGANDLLIGIGSHELWKGDLVHGGSYVVSVPEPGEAAEVVGLGPAIESSWRAGHVGVGDVDRDGRDDVAVMWPYAVGMDESLLFLASLDTVGPYELPEAFARTTMADGLNDEQFRAAGDVDGDGTIDLLLADEGAESVQVVRTGQWQGDVPLATLGPSLRRGPSQDHFGTAAGGGDVDGDGRDDVLVSARTRGGTSCLVVGLPASGVVELDTDARCWGDGDLWCSGGALLPDLDGDGRAEVALSFGDLESGALYVLTSTQALAGAPFEEAAITVIGRLDDPRVADLTGEGTADLVFADWVLPGEALRDLMP